MDIQLWRWSAAVQLSSLVMIAVFFAALSRSVRRAELGWWLLAWLANLTALGITLFYWSFQPDGELLGPLLRGSYMGTKTAFVLCLGLGAWALKRPGARAVGRAHLAGGLVLYTLLCALFVGTIVQIGIIQHALMGALFLMGGLLLLRPPVESGLSWLAAGFFARSALSLVEASAYGLQVLSAETVSASLRASAATFLSAHSSFDSGSEWFLALGCVLALSERSARELHRYNLDLLAAQDKLRKLVARDPLTALANRRSLPAIFESVRERGATLLFFDLDGFKLINDLHGHQAGDACLQRFAAALGHCFRPGDALVRYAGDEFLVVASGLDRPSAEARIDELRRRLREEGVSPELTFSVGVSELAPGGDPDTALRAADESMYRAKGERPFPTRLATA